MNRDLEHERFRIQELANTEITGDLSSEGPAYGRRYEIFFNKVKVGLLQIMADHFRHFDAQNKSVYADVALNGAPVTALPYQQVYGFLWTIASLVASTNRKPHDGSRTE